MNADVREDDLPGIGRRFEMTCENGGVLTIVVYNNGRRDLYAFSEPGAQPSVITLRDEQAHAAADILEGSWSSAPEARRMQEAIDDLAIDWVTLHPGSPGTGRTIGELGIRSTTGVTVMSILRQHGVIHHPRPEEELLAGDRLVVAARRDRLDGFRRLVVGTER